MGSDATSITINSYSNREFTKFIWINWYDFIFCGRRFTDRFSVKLLLAFSLVASGGLGFNFGNIPKLQHDTFNICIMGHKTIMTFFSASVKVVRMQGSESEQGRIFGFYEGLSGISGTLISFIGLYFFGKFTEITVGFKYVVWLYSAAIYYMWYIIIFTCG